MIVKLCGFALEDVATRNIAGRIMESLRVIPFTAELSESNARGVIEHMCAVISRYDIEGISRAKDFEVLRGVLLQVVKVAKLYERYGLSLLSDDYFSEDRPYGQGYTTFHIARVAVGATGHRHSAR